MIRYIFSYLIIYFLWSIRWILSLDGKYYLLLFIPQTQSFLDWIGKLRGYAVFYKAQKSCPAYQNFLKAENYQPQNSWNINNLPIMTKENYVKKFSIEERCYNGKIPVKGTIIDESSGSSGVPNNWVRSAEERKDVKRILQLNYGFVFGEESLILLNCFALGPWATGMNVSMSLVDVGILKSIGPDATKLENTLTLFGPKYKYVICGYPPFLKMWLDNTNLDLSQFEIHAIVGGEGMSESLRNNLLKSFKTAISSYGASDLEINIGVETELTVELRRLCFNNRELCEKLFERETPPMIFQYNAADYIIETNQDKELLFTIVRLESAAPKIRYNLKDLGGTFTHKNLSKILSENGIEISSLAEKQSAFPMVYVHGRGDLSVPFYGAKVFPTDLEQIISTQPNIVGKINSFQLQSVEDKNLKRTLIIHLEKIKNYQNDLPQINELNEIIFDELCRINQDFREVTKIFDKSCVQINLHDFEKGVFEGRDIRIKNKYIN